MFVTFILVVVVAGVAGALGWLAGGRRGANVDGTAAADASRDAAVATARADALGAELARVEVRADAVADSLCRAQAEAARLGAVLAGREAELGATRTALAERGDALRAAAEVSADCGRLQAMLAAREAELAGERTAMADKLALVNQARQALADQFSALSAQALERNNASFLALAEQSMAAARSEASGDLAARSAAVEHLVAPITDTLIKVEARMQDLEHARQRAEATLAEQVRGMGEAQERLRAETGNLVNALRTPQVRGRWGELQLRRVVELAGMVRHCDFDEQVSAPHADGGRVRPDLIVRLPGGKQVVVDAKVPLLAYLQAAEAADDVTRSLRLKDHARQLRNHVDALAAKAYWEQFDPTPDLVVMFIPGDPILAAALEADAGLLEYAAAKRVLPATPVTLIGLLQAIAFGWRQEVVAEQARTVCELGRELYRRLGTMGDHLDRTGRALDRAVDAYNSTVGSLENRVLVTARKLADTEVAEGELGSPGPVDRDTRRLQAAELVKPTLTPPAIPHDPEALSA